MHINNCLENQFQQSYPVSMENCSFQTYGHIFPDEILVIVSLLQPHSSPMSLFVSQNISSSAGVDLASMKKDIDKSIEKMIDLTGIFFDEVLSHNDWSNYTLDWVEETYKNTSFYLKTTREHIDLTLEANNLLGPEFSILDSDTL